MNAIQQAEQLKMLSDQQLQMARGRMPEFLLLAELQRRQQMRKAFEADKMQAQKSGRTVSDELWSSVMPPVPPPMGGPAPQMQGPGSSPSPVPAPQMMPQQQPMSMGGMIQRLAQGGVVRYAEGGAMAAIQQILGSMQQPRSLADYTSEAAASAGPDQLSPIMAEMAQQRATPAVGKPSPWQALMRMGAGMMASRNPTPMGGLGEGLTQALNGYSQDRAAYQSDLIRMQEMQQRMLAQRAQLAGAMNDRNMGMARLGASIRGDDAAMRNTNLGLMGNAALSDSANERAMKLEAMREAAMKPLRDSQIAENQAQAEQRAIQSQVFQSYLRKAGGDPAKAQIMMAQEQAAAQYIDRPQRMDPLRAGVMAEMRAEGRSFKEINDYFDRKDEQMENTLKIQRERLVAQDMAALAKDMRFAMASPEEKQKAQMESFIRHSQNLGLAVPGGGQQQIPPPVGAWDPKRKAFVSMSESKPASAIGGKGHSSKGGGMTVEEWRKSLQLKPANAISASDIPGMFGK